LLYDWIGSREIRSIEQEYSLYRGAVKRLGEGFSWLADCLAAVAEDIEWKKERKEDLEKIQCLSRRLVEGVEEEGLKLSRLHIPGLTRSYIRRLVKEGYEDEECLKEIGRKGLGEVLPGRLVKRIQERIQEKIKEEKEEEIRIKKERQEQESKKEKEKKKEKKISVGESCYEKSGIHDLQTVLEIDKRRPDRIIFEGKEVKVTTIGFSLLYLLAQHRGQVVSYEEILKKLWGDDEDSIYTRINYHICKIRKDISKTTNNKNRNIKKVENIFKTIPGRGLMLNIKEKELEINL